MSCQRGELQCFQCFSKFNVFCCLVVHLFLFVQTSIHWVKLLSNPNKQQARPYRPRCDNLEQRIHGMISGALSNKKHITIQIGKTAKTHTHKQRGSYNKANHNSTRPYRPRGRQLRGAARGGLGAPPVRPAHEEACSIIKH